MTKQSIFGRISQLAKANINSLLDSAEDPQKMIDQMIRDYRNNIAEAEKAIAQTIGNLRLAQEDYKEDMQSAQTWGQKALAASNKAEEMATAGKSSEAEKFNNLARIAIEKQLTAENDARTSEPTIASQEEVVEKLKLGLNQMQDKLRELNEKRNQLVARAKTAQAQNQITDSLKSVNMMDPTSELSRFEDKVRREEARALGSQELAASSLDSQFAELDDLGELSEVEARLSALKAGNSSPGILESGNPSNSASSDSSAHASITSDPDSATPADFDSAFIQVEQPETSSDSNNSSSK